MSELFIYSLFAFLAGITFNLMPCVLPVMPFKIQAMLREIESTLTARVLAAAALLGGSIGFFLLLGMATISLGLLWGELFQSSWFQGALSLFLLLAAVATFAEWSLSLPQFLYRIPAHKYVGAALTGALAGILSTPCSGPFLGSVLAYAVAQPPASVLMLFISIGTGLAFPYVVLLTWPGLMDRLRFSGPWTLQVKQFLGFILLGGAVFFSRPLIPDIIHSAGWLLLGGALMVWACRDLIKSQSWGQRVMPIVSMGLVIMVISLSTGIFKIGEGELNWQPFEEAALERARANAQPVLIEFTADWCLNCKVLESTVYKTTKVLSAVREMSMLTLRVDITDMSAAKKALLGRYGGFAIPFLVLLDRHGQVSQTFTGLMTDTTLAAAINKAGGTS